jgi:hypothetical protein
MKKVFYSLVALLIVASLLPLKSQDVIKNSSITGICYAGKKVNRIYIPRPAKSLARSGKKGNAKVTIYYTGFTAQAKDAIAEAGSILEDILPDNTSLTISASWEKITTAGVLAHSSMTAYVGGWAIDALNPLAYYPVALAEKILGAGINDETAGDIRLVVNSNFSNWYFGTDGNTPKTKYDLVTVALHEICHGLGFFDTMDTDGVAGWYGINFLPIIYETFVENNYGQKLTDTLIFHNYSASLAEQFTNDNLFFKGPVLGKYTSGGKAKLWAPPVFDRGSSISHLDEDTFLDENALMTPYVDLGEAIHNPGKLTLSILGDIGWINTRLSHTPPKDTEEHLTDILLSLKIESDTTYNRDKVGIVFSFDEFQHSDTVFMSSQYTDNNFNARITIPSYNNELQYYFFAEDYFLRTYRLPSLNELFRYRVFIGTDTVKPLISHTPVSYYFETTDSISFNAFAVDNLGIDTVYIEYKVNGGLLHTIGLKRGSLNNFSAAFKAETLDLHGGDSIKYRIYATDSAYVPNISVMPESGYFAIPVEGLESVVDSYSTDFANAVPDFFNLGFEISKPAGLTKFGLNTKHPYESPEENDKSIDYTALLRHPLKFKESGMLITFNEIVLVEPGEPGSLYGSPDFYDYVIVEGSKDFGKTWFALIDGYDSRFIATWETAYNNSIVGQNSTVAGTESMLRKHTIFYKPSARISAGDTMLLRFRLYSDPYANGWGWVIEDLKIKPLIDAIDDVVPGKIKIYPNPGNGRLYVILDQDYMTGKSMRYSVLNSLGSYIVNNKTITGSENSIDISPYPAGLYIIVLYIDDGIKTFKYNLIK